MFLSILSALIEFAQEHPGIVIGRIAIALLLLSGAIAYRRLYRISKQAASENAELIDNLTEGVYRSSPDGQQLSANQALVKLNGYKTEAELLSSIKDMAKELYVNPERRAEFLEQLAKHDRVENFVSEVYRHKTRERIWISESARIVRDPKSGEAIRYEGSVREVTDSVHRREIEERFRKLTDMLPGGLFQLVRDQNGVFSAPYVSSGFCRTVGISETSQVDNPHSYFQNLHPEDRESYVKSLRDSGVNLETWNTEFRVVDKDGTERWLHVVAQPERTGETTTWHGYIADITIRKRQEIEIEEMAFVDPLTGLPNRRVLMDRIAQTLADCKRRNQYGAALYIDLDHFKELNDAHGHETGDIYLKQVANRLRETIRGADTVARIGGDEFVVLLRSIGNSGQFARNNALNIAQKMLAELREPYLLKKIAYKATASLGIVVFDGLHGDAEAILKQADQAMYDAKYGGRNSVGTAFVCMLEDKKDTDGDDLLTQELISAIRQRHLEFRFEPQMDNNGLLIGAEGFLCWEHPEHGAISADRIAPFAYKAGLATDLDLVAIETAIETLSIWQRSPDLKSIRLSVNAGTSILLDERTYGTIKSLMEQHRIRPGLLTIEITEQVQRSAREQIAGRMRELKALGIRFALDDFGSGYSSITYLRQLQFDEVKIEGAFVAGIDGDEENEALVKTILAMAKTLGISAVAEHVESESQEAFLRAYGCDVFQGCRYGTEMNRHEFAEFAASGQDRTVTQATA